MFNSAFKHLLLLSGLFGFAHGDYNNASNFDAVPKVRIGVRQAAASSYTGKVNPLPTNFVNGVLQAPVAVPATYASTTLTGSTLQVTTINSAPLTFPSTPGSTIITQTGQSLIINLVATASSSAPPLQNTAPVFTTTTMFGQTGQVITSGTATITFGNTPGTTFITNTPQTLIYDLIATSSSSNSIPPALDNHINNAPQTTSTQTFTRPVGAVVNLQALNGSTFGIATVSSTPVFATDIGDTLVFELVGSGISTATQSISGVTGSPRNEIVYVTGATVTESGTTLILPATPTNITSSATWLLGSVPQTEVLTIIVLGN